jgi:hypothetical protein
MAGKRKLVDLVVDRYVNLELFYHNQKPQANGCINWTGVTNNIGYPFIGFRTIDATTGEPEKNSTRMMLATRLALMIKLGRAIQPGMNSNHSCNNKLCCNPDHLEEGTQKEKLDYMIKTGIKGGRTPGVPVGSYNHEQTGRKYKYSKEDITWVRAASLEDIAERYNISRDDAARKRWAFRRGYRWLPCPVFEKERRGPKKKK